MDYEKNWYDKPRDFSLKDYDAYLERKKSLKSPSNLQMEKIIKDAERLYSTETARQAYIELAMSQTPETDLSNENVVDEQKYINKLNNIFPGLLFELESKVDNWDKLSSKEKYELAVAFGAIEDPIKER